MSSRDWTRYADVAQVAERKLPKFEVVGSIPTFRFKRVFLLPDRTHKHRTVNLTKLSQSSVTREEDSSIFIDPYAGWSSW